VISDDRHLKNTNSHSKIITADTTDIKHIVGEKKRSSSKQTKHRRRAATNQAVAGNSTLSSASSLKEI